MFISNGDTQIECTKPEFKIMDEVTVVSFSAVGIITHDDIQNILDTKTFYIYDENAKMIYFEAKDKDLTNIKIDYGEALRYKIKIKFLTKGVVDDESNI